MNHRVFGISVLMVPGVLVLFGASCSSDNGTVFSSEQAGKERGPCREDRSCDEGLECRSDLCVSASGSGGSLGGEGGEGGEGGMMSAGGEGGEGGTLAAGGAGDAGASGSGGSAAGVGGEAGAPATAGASGEAGAGGAGGNGVVCEGVHPNVEGPRRFCDAGSCYCSNPFDSCFAEEIVEACCKVDARCGDEPADRGINCAGSHPIVGPPRTCQPGSCLCSNGATVDACFPADVASACCPPDIELKCVAE